MSSVRRIMKTNPISRECPCCQLRSFGEADYRKSWIIDVFPVTFWVQEPATQVANGGSAVSLSFCLPLDFLLGALLERLCAQVPQ